MGDETDHDHRSSIPAAGIGDTDLAAVAATDPEAAKEIARLEALMRRGEETPDEFLRLCRLLHEVGSTAAAEHLLRRNLDFYGGMDLYLRLFGTAKQDEFEAAVRAFEVQFGMKCEPVAHKSFLVCLYHTASGPPRADEFALLSRPCEVTFDYVERDRVEADVVPDEAGRDVFGPGECLLLFFVGGRWRVADPLGA